MQHSASRKKTWCWDIKRKFWRTKLVCSYRDTCTTHISWKHKKKIQNIFNWPNWIHLSKNIHINHFLNIKNKFRFQHDLTKTHVCKYLVLIWSLYVHISSHQTFSNWIFLFLFFLCSFNSKIEITLGAVINKRLVKTMNEVILLN